MNLYVESYWKATNFRTYLEIGGSQSGRCSSVFELVLSWFFQFSFLQGSPRISETTRRG